MCTGVGWTVSNNNRLVLICGLARNTATTAGGLVGEFLNFVTLAWLTEKVVLGK